MIARINHARIIEEVEIACGIQHLPDLLVEMGRERVIAAQDLAQHLLVANLPRIHLTAQVCYRGMLGPFLRRNSGGNGNSTSLY